MSLTLSPKKTRKIKVKATQPGDLLESQDFDFVAEFKVLPADQWKKLMDDEAGVAEVVELGLVSVEGIEDESGKVLPSSPELVKALLDEAWILTPLLTAQLAIQGGVTQSELYKKAKRKN